jgi:alpha-L-rhamnosidase
MVGWPYFTIDAPAGTIVELMPQESHDPTKTAWLDTHFFSWSRFICREGLNHFETFDYESLRWLQLHIRDASRPVTIRDVGVRRRQFAWRHEPHVRSSDPALQSLFDASVNTLRNSAMETVVDGMGRERQQYSGDGAHQLHAVRYAFGETRLGRRYLRTFSEGLTKDGYFLDCWPASDRLARIPQKEMDGAFWGPLLDHGVGFNFDCWNHYFETGERESIAEPYPRLVRFGDYLWSLRGADGLLPVENLGIPTVWMDHNAYKQQRHKQCAFNLYAAAMYWHALGPLAALMGDLDRAHVCEQRGAALLASTRQRFWSASRGTFVNNLPWATDEGEVRLCDRSLSTAILFDQCPESNTAASLRALAECPAEMGFSYPANQGWRMWALAKMRRVDVILRDLRTRWIAMRSVRENNTLQEDWNARTDSTAEWSHCPLAPLFVTFMDLAGIRPLTPGFEKCRICPQLGDLPDLDLTAWTPRGPIEFSANAEGAGHRVRVSLPENCEGELVVPATSTVRAERIGSTAEGLARFRLPAGTSIDFQLASR